MKSILAKFDSQKVPFLQFQRLLILNLVNLGLGNGSNLLKVKFRISKSGKDNIF